MQQCNMRTTRSFCRYIVFLSIVCLIYLLMRIANHQSENLHDFALVSSDESSVDDALKAFEFKRIVNCHENPAKFSVGQRGNYMVFYNFVKGSKPFHCHDTVTFTAPADFTFMDNLLTLVQHWEGPISVALYAPGSDFNQTLRSIAYLRNCQSKLIKQWVTFHVFIHEEHFPKKINGRPLTESYLDSYNCTAGAPYIGIKPNETYRRLHNLTFPINVARNIARQAAQTHYVFAADIELYPSASFIERFLSMMRKHPEYVNGGNPRVFVLPIFEVEAGVHVPSNKTDLQQLYKKGKAFLFHKTICAVCHSIPNLKGWMNMSETNEFDIVSTVKRLGKQRFWEAFYVGTKEDPLFDERLSWEGQSNKMTQGYSMCLLNYDYMIMNNAFIIHKPGIKKSKEQVTKFGNEVTKSNELIKRVIKPDLINLYGNREGCHL